jgi:multiple sugar transport system substrate-binding protein
MKKNMKNIVKLALTTIISTTVLFGCGIDGTNTKANVGMDENEVIVVDFWTAPQVVQFNYWSEKADAFNAANIKVNDKTVVLKVQQMPESPSSEAGIQNALATDTAPALSENINRGFAKILSTSDAIYELSNESWFSEVIKSRAMEDGIKAWQIDGNQYVLPIYVNPMVYQWNMNALRAMGLNEPPKTIDDLKNFISIFRLNKDSILKDMGVTNTFFRPSLSRQDQWWERWFDFQMQYAAFTGGKGWVESDELILEKQATKEVFELYGLLGDTIQTSELSVQWTSEDIPYLFSISAPWEIQMMREANKVYGLDGDYIYSQPIVKNIEDSPYCFGDSKGLVLYKDDNITEEMHLGAVEFIKWVYNKNNTVKTDLDWLEATNMLPARGDLIENSEFSSFLNENKELEGLASFVPFSVPSMASDKMTDIQSAFTEFGFAPYFEKVQKSSDLNVPDASKDIEAAFEAMLNILK